MKIVGRFALNFVDFPSKNNENPKFSGASRPKMLGDANSSQGALIFSEFSKPEILGGAN